MRPRREARTCRVKSTRTPPTGRHWPQFRPWVKGEPRRSLPIARRPSPPATGRLSFAAARDLERIKGIAAGHHGKLAAVSFVPAGDAACNTATRRTDCFICPDLRL